MEQWKVRFFVNVMFTHNGETTQQNFTKTYNSAGTENEIINAVFRDIKNHEFLTGDNGHYYRTTTITDCSIEKIEREGDNAQ